MIQLTRFNGEVFVLNADLIQYVEARPDTYITLTNSERIIVREPVEEVIHRAVDYARTLRLLPRVA